MGLQADFSGAFAKTAMLKRIPQAAKLQATRWLVKTEYDLMRSASNMKKSVSWGHHKSSQLQRNIGKDISSTDSGWMLTVGTGIGGKQTVKYASIQDKGGTIRPKGHPFLTIPMPGVTGRARDYPNSFLATSAGGQWMIAQSTGKRQGGLKVLFLLRRKVDLPATRWFTSVIERREPRLRELMDPEVVKNIASQMSGGKG